MALKPGNSLDPATGLTRITTDVGYAPEHTLDAGVPAHIAIGSGLPQVGSRPARPASTAALCRRLVPVGRLLPVGRASENGCYVAVPPKPAPSPLRRAPAMPFVLPTLSKQDCEAATRSYPS